MQAINDKASFYQLLQSRKEIIKSFGIKRLGLLGSFMKGKVTDGSDVLVEFHTGQKSCDNFYNLYVSF